MSEKIMVNGNLKELHSSGFEMKAGEPDIRGWKVKNNKSQIVGKVNELLFDTDSLRIRYLILGLDGKPLNLISRQIIIPIGLAELDKADKIVMLPEVTTGHLGSLPEYKKDNVTIENERRIRNVFAPSEGVEYSDPDYYDPKEFYNHKYFDAERMYQSPAYLSENKDNEKMAPGRNSNNKYNDEKKDPY